MGWNEITRNADERKLRLFSLVWLPVGMGVVGSVFLYISGSWTVAITIWSIGLTMAVLGTAFARLRPLWYFGLTALTFPIGWIVFHALMLVMYFCVFTPFGVLLRLFGRDSLGLRRTTAGTSYWKPRPPAPDTSRYFRQY